MPESREVVITGIGVVSPIGIGNDAFWDSLEQRRSGVAELTLFDPSTLTVKFGAEVRDFKGKKYITPRKSIKVMCREVQLGFAAAVLAMQQAGLERGTVDPDRLGVLYGGEMFYGELPELEEIYRQCLHDGKFSFEPWGEHAMTDIFPLWMLKYLPNMAACHIGIAFDGRGPNNTITLGEVSSLLAIIEAVDVIRRGQADVMIAGGTGSRLNVTPMMYRGDANLSRRNDDPQAASRPFDAMRDGIVNGEGSGALVLESRDHAAARNADVLANVLSFGSSYEDCTNGQAGLGAGIRRAIKTALQRAELEPRQIGHLNAHGISIVEDDAAEAQAIRDTLGDIPVTAPKSFFGNLGAGGGAVEIAASLLALGKGRVPVTLNYDHPDPNCPVNVVHEEAIAIDQPCAMSINKAGTGQTAAIVFAGP